jgi:gas vesicle protein
VRSLARQIKEHPMPSLLIGGGLAWLIADTDDDESRTPPGHLAGAARSAGHAVGETLDHAKEAASDALGTAKEKLADTGHTLHEKGEQVVHQIQETSKTALAKARHGISDSYHAGAERFGHAVEEYPLAVGVAFAALGLLAGISLPHTRKEDQWLGEKSDEVIEAAKEKGDQLLESGKAVGARVLEAVKEGAEEQGLTGSKLAGTLSELADKGAQVLEKAKEEAKQAVDDEGLKPPSPSS